jgi:uncharacterized delta-60 repeat protein
VDEAVPKRASGRRLRLAAGAICALSISLAAHGAPPPMDTSFGTNGVAAYPAEGIAPASLTVLSDGRILASMQHALYSASAYNGSLPPPRYSLFRFLADGTLDASFGAGGSIGVPSRLHHPFEYNASFPIAELPGGGFVMAGLGTDKFAHQKFRDDGTPAGPLVLEEISPQAGCTATQVSLLGIRAQPDGKVVVYGTLTRSDFGGAPLSEICLAVARYLPQGGLDAGFANGGKRVVPNFGLNSHALLEASGKLSFGSLSSIGNGALSVLKLNSDGSPDVSSGPGGIRRIPVSLEFGCIASHKLAAEGIIIAKECGTYSEVARFTPQGESVPSFGTGGTVRLALDHSYRGAKFLQRDGAVVIVGSTANGPGYVNLIVERLRPDGSPDPSFGPARTFTVHGEISEPFAAVLQPDGNLLLTSYNRSSFAVASGTPSNLTLIRVRTAAPLVEFHNTLLDHYFISLEDDEARGIDNGAAGAGWRRTGQTFASGGPGPTCRFYGAAANSHFFTTEPGECESVKRDPGWALEGIGFYATRVSAQGCPSNLRSVHRLYNHRAAQHDPNHRFVVDTGLIPAMTSAGWIHEGVVFCAPK